MVCWRSVCVLWCLTAVFAVCAADGPSVLNPREVMCLLEISVCLWCLTAVFAVCAADGLQC